MLLPGAHVPQPRRRRIGQGRMGVSTTIVTPGTGRGRVPRSGIHNPRLYDRRLSNPDIDVLAAAFFVQGNAQGCRGHVVVIIIMIGRVKESIILFFLLDRTVLVVQRCVRPRQKEEQYQPEDGKAK